MMERGHDLLCYKGFRFTTRHSPVVYCNVSLNSSVTNDHLCRVSLCIRSQYALQPIVRSGGKTWGTSEKTEGEEVKK